MKRRKPPHAKAVREPVQVYLAADDSALLARLAADAKLSKAEVLRRGVRSFAREQGGPSPMLRFLEAAPGMRAPRGTAKSHDAVLAASYRATRKTRP
jgi:hypothetical protein